MRQRQTTILLVMAMALVLLSKMTAGAALSLESVYPNQGVMGKDLPVTLKGSGFESGTRISMILDIGNKKANNGTVVTPGNSAYAVAIAGGYAFVADGSSGLQVIDVHDKKKPQLVTSVTPSNAMVEDVDILGNYAYVADWNNGLLVYDISVPTSPQLIGSLLLDTMAHGIKVSGSTAFLEDSGGLRIIDVSDPAHPQILSTFDTYYMPHRADIANSIAYVVNGAMLITLDVSNLAEPKYLGYASISGFAGGVVVIGQTAFVAADTTGVVAVDVSDPTAPQVIATLKTPGAAYGITAQGSTLYVADWRGGLQMIDASTPTDLKLIGSVDTPGWAYEVAVDGETAYIADEWKGLRVIDISNPSLPPAIGQLDTGKVDTANGSTQNDTTGLDRVGNLAYVTDRNYGLRIVDITDPAKPVIVGGAAASSKLNDVLVIGNNAFVADENFGLQVLNVSNPANPTFFASKDTPGHAWKFVIVDNKAYVADGESGLQIIDVSNPSQMKILGSVNTPGWAYGITVVGDRAYVADGEAGLQVIDITNSSQPTIIGTLDTPGEAWSVRVIGQTAYVADKKEGLQLIDITNPTAPALIGNLKMAAGTWAWDISVVGNTAYVANCAYGILVLDVTNPTQPTVIGSIGTIGSARRVIVADNKALVADWNSGLVIVPLPVEITPITVKDGNHLSLTLPSPAISGNYTLWAFNGSENFELPGAVNFSSLDLAKLDANGLMIQNLTGVAAPTALDPGKAVNLQLIYNSPNGTPFNLSDLTDFKVEWFSSNPKALLINGEGRLVAMAPGTATITAQINSGKKSIELTVNGSSGPENVGNLIIVSGRKYQEESLAPFFAGMGNRVYETFSGRGFAPEDINYFSAYGQQYLAEAPATGIVDRVVEPAEAGLAQEVTAAVTSWAAGQATSGPLYIYLLDHGATNQALMPISTKSTLTGAMLDVALDKFEQETGREVIVVVEACYSGAWLTALGQAGRVVISSTADALTQENLPTDNLTSFSENLFAGLAQGRSFGQAITEAADKIKTISYAVGQTPKFTATGIDLNKRYLVGPFATAGKTPLFVKHTGQGQPVTTLPGVAVALTAELNMPYANGFEVWAAITPPASAADGDFLTPAVTSINIPLSYTGSSDPEGYFGGDKLFAATGTGLDTPGVYDLTFYARNLSGQVIASEHTALVVQNVVPPVDNGEVILKSSSGDFIPSVLAVDDGINLIITPAAGGTSAIAVSWVSSNPAVLTVDSNGHVTAQAPGKAKVTAIFPGGFISQELTVTGSGGAKTQGNLILIAGISAQESGAQSLAAVFKGLAQQVYNTFNNRGFGHEDISFLSPYGAMNLAGESTEMVDIPFAADEVGVSNKILSQITTWAKGQDNSGPLYLCFFGHGSSGKLVTNAVETLSAADLDTALDEFQAATGRPVVVLLEACYSGSFVAPLTAANRIVLSSTGNEVLYLPTMGKSCFSNYFLSELSKGLSLNAAFAKASETIKTNQPKQVPQNAAGISPLWGSPLVGNFASASASFITDYTGKNGALTLSSGAPLALSLSADLLNPQAMTAYAVLTPPTPEEQPDSSLLTPTVAAIQVQLSLTGAATYSGQSPALQAAGNYLLTYYLQDVAGETYASDPVEVQVMNAVSSTTTSVTTTSTTTTSTEATPSTTLTVGTTTTTLPPAGESLTMNLVQGWNLLSSTIGFPAATVLGNGDKLTSVWKWEGGKWAVYLPGEIKQGDYAASKNFGVLAAINPGEGFWVNSNSAQQVTVNGPLSTGELSFSQGWNLLGLPSGNPVAVAELVAGKEVVSVWKWENGTWAVYLPAEPTLGAYAKSKNFGVLGTINPGEGFWVNVQ